MSKTDDGIGIPMGETTGCEHCWHRQDCQHTIAVSPGFEHEDQVCCHCGAQRCDISFRHAPELDGHGPHHPDSFCFQLNTPSTGVMPGTGTIRVREDDHG